MLSVRCFAVLFLSLSWIGLISSQGTSTTSAPLTTRRRAGAGDVVTPEPIVGPTTAPQILEMDGNKCICVPYYLCDPSTNTIKSDGSIDGFGVIDIRFNPQSCQEILDVCCQENKTVEVPINPTPVNERPGRAQGCGIRNVGGIDFQITGNMDNEAGFGEFPWTVALLKIPEENCLCHGSLIQPNIVLTAFHCVSGGNPSQFKIRAGEWDTQTTKERLPYQERVATRFIGHPEYKKGSLANDFALVVLNLPFELDEHIALVCLPPPSLVPSGNDCYATGWGKDVFGQAGKYSVIMKSVKLPLVPHGQCQDKFRQTRLGARFNLHASFICAGGQPGVDTCTGDGGAPLVCPVGPPAENRYAEMGIVSWGIGCKENYPAAYANVPLARSWIDAQVTMLSGDPSLYSY